MMTGDVVKEEFGDVLGLADGGARDEMGTLGKAAENDIDAIVTVVGRVETTLRSPWRQIVNGIGGLASTTRTDIGFDVGKERGPVEVTGDIVKGFLEIEVSNSLGVVVFIQELGTETTDGRDAKAVSSFGVDVEEMVDEGVVMDNVKVEEFGVGRGEVGAGGVAMDEAMLERFGNVDMRHGSKDFLRGLMIGSAREGIGNTIGLAGSMANGEGKLGEKVQPTGLTRGDILSGEDSGDDGVVVANGKVLAIEDGKYLLDVLKVGLEGGCKVFSKIDLKSGYHQIKVDPADQHKTAFKTRDGLFISADWKDFTSQTYDMKLKMHPEANGLAEEINQTVIQLLRALIVPDQNSWDEELPIVQGLYKNSIHSSIGTTPNRLHLGWKIRNPLSYLFPEQPPGLTPGQPGFNTKYDRLLKVVVAAMERRRRDKTEMALDTWLRTVPMWVRAKRTLVEEEVITVASYLEGSAARWLNGLVASKGFGRNMGDCAKTHTLESFMDLVELEWHNPQQAQIATDGLLKLDVRKYKSVRELTTAVERLIVVSGVEYNPQVLLTMFLRCLSTNIKNLLDNEAQLEYHTFETFSKKALDLEATFDYLRALIYEFGLSENVTRSLGEAYKEDPITMDIINKLKAKDMATTDEFVMVDGLLFLEKAGFKSKSGKKHIFVIGDRFTKFARLIAMSETAKTEHVIKLFMDNWVRNFGLPTTIVSDRDVRFTSEMWKKTAEQMGSQLQMTSGNHPEANGQAEQMNRVVQHLLRHYINLIQDDWDKKLPLIASLYNNAVHSTIKVTPNQLHLGWKLRSALDFLLPENRPAATPGTIEFSVQYEKLLRQVVENIKNSQEAMIASQNKHDNKYGLRLFNTRARGAFMVVRPAAHGFTRAGETVGGARRETLRRATVKEGWIARGFGGRGTLRRAAVNGGWVAAVRSGGVIEGCLARVVDMGRAQRRQHEAAVDHMQDTFRACSPVYRYLVAGQKVDNKGVMMLRCTFCNKVFQGTQFQATRHFSQTNYCKDVSDEALYEIARQSQQKFEANQMERVARYAAEPGLDVPGTGGARGGEAGRRPVEGGVGGDGGHGAPDPTLGGGGGETEEGVIHVDRKACGPGKEGVPEREDVPEFYPGTGERLEDWRRRAGKGAATDGSSKRKTGGSDTAATPTRKRLRQQKVTDVYGGEWVARHKKEFLRWLYSSGVSFNAFRNQAWKGYQQVLLEQSGGSPRAVLPNHCEIVSIRAVETHRAELAEELEEVRQPFWVTGATLLSDGRKSRDGRPIVNFLAAGSRGVVVYMTINREGEADDAVHVLWRWVTIFHEFSFGGPQRINAICTDSASAYVGAARALASPSMPPALRRITWLPCSVHVCNKLLSDMGTSCDAFVDAITRARVLVVIFKTHQAALHFFRTRSPDNGLFLSCETWFASVYSMLESLLALQDTLQDMMRRDDTRAFASIAWSADVCVMARWVRRQIRWDPWWQRVATIVHIMQPVMELLRRMDRGGQYMSLMIEWTQDLVRRVTDACAPLGKSFADRIIRRVQARTQHMLEPAHCAGFLLNPRRRHVRYFSGQVDRYDAWLVGQAKRYILTLTGFELEGAKYILACRQFEDFHIHGDSETIECASWWSQFGSGAPELQRCALQVMHMWYCASPAERNWAVHEGIHTKKRNQLAFEKVVQLVEITANVRLSEYRRAGRGYVLPWQRDEGTLACQAGLELQHVPSGTRRGMTEEEIARQVALITRDPIGASAPPSADAVFDRRACIFRPYPREDDSDEEPVPEAADDPTLRIPREIDETHEDPDSAETREHTARRAADRAEREMLGGEEEFWGPFGEVASTGSPEAQATTPTPTRRESSMPPPPAPSPAPPSPVSPLQPATAMADREELGSSLPQRGLLHRGGAEEGAPSAAAVESSVALAAVPDTTILAAVEEIAAAAAAVLEEMVASVLEDDPPAAGGGAAVEGQVAAAGGVGGGAAAVEVEVAAAVEEEEASSAAAVEGEVPGPVEEEIAAQAEVQRGGHDERLMQQFLTEELDSVIAGMTPGVARGFGISDSEMGTHLDLDLSMGLPPSCGGATSTDRAPSRDEAPGQTWTQTARERTTTESPDATRDIMERERARLLTSSDPRAQWFARAVEEARRREIGGDCVQGGVVAREDVAEGLVAEPVPEAMPGGAEAADVAVEGWPQAVDEAVQREALHLERVRGRRGWGCIVDPAVSRPLQRVVVLRKGGGPVTIEEDDPDTDAAVRDADEDYEGEEGGEEESRSGSDGDDKDNYDEPPPPPGPPPTPKAVALHGYRPGYWYHQARWKPVSGEGPWITAILNYDGGDELVLKINEEGGREGEMRTNSKLQDAISETRDRAERRCRRDGVTARLRITVAYHEIETSMDTADQEQIHQDTDSGGESEMSDADRETDLRSWNRPGEIERHHRAVKSVEQGPWASSRQLAPRGRETGEERGRGKGRV
ncbi:hypothetical protein CBR_g4691 [Chara braunii]|uniref:Integrase catalytic domain-containing protein n=1 Tax=Chara braunii TaxID=69332 RepID=A0A388KII4_CHABU|nr:hypothetical protein CBR_g4691 [Chara braunii]|eukprot:GBG69864.1 hypothetical protein CBR_g4691 [Chara braunii]